MGEEARELAESLHSIADVLEQNADSMDPYVLSEVETLVDEIVSVVFQEPTDDELEDWGDGDEDY